MPTADIDIDDFQAQATESPKAYKRIRICAQVLRKGSWLKTYNDRKENASMAFLLLQLVFRSQMKKEHPEPSKKSSVWATKMNADSHLCILVHQLHVV